MKLKKIEIEGLYGTFDHEIKLKSDERITIIHGPNGVGKTTVLRLIHDIIRMRFFFNCEDLF
jgi:predicted ATP-binding protein involved in virulence